MRKVKAQSFLLGFLLALLLFNPDIGRAYFRLTAQSAPYLVIPKNRRTSSSSASSVNAELQQVRASVLDLVNQERTKRRFVTLKANALLEKSAQLHAEDMLKKKYFSHDSLDRRKPEDRIRAAGYFLPLCVSSESERRSEPMSESNCKTFFAYGENIAKRQKTAKDVMSAWMKSKIHRDNILNPDFRELGVGFAGDLWVQNFGTITVQK